MHYKAIRLLRIEKGWTQEELAKKANISALTVCLIETGKTRPSVDTIRKLTGALDVDPGLLMAYEGKFVFDDTTK